MSSGVVQQKRGAQGSGKKWSGAGFTTGYGVRGRGLERAVCKIDESCEGWHAVLGKA